MGGHSKHWVSSANVQSTLSGSKRTPLVMCVSSCLSWRVVEHNDNQVSSSTVVFEASHSERKGQFWQLVHYLLRSWPLEVATAGLAGQVSTDATPDTSVMWVTFLTALRPGGQEGAVEYAMGHHLGVSAAEVDPYGLMSLKRKADWVEYSIRVERTQLEFIVSQFHAQFLAWVHEAFPESETYQVSYSNSDRGSGVASLGQFCFPISHLTHQTINL
eukprot:3483368-Amphidinium_carterae.2